MKVYKVPTGHICTMEGEKGKQLEFLSIGDYGKEANIKADFLGLTKEINGVAHGECIPLEEKWVITISSQYGCSMKCSFCDVPKVGSGINATLNDLKDQVVKAMSLHPEVKSTKRLNLHYARMGEPTWNWDVIIHASVSSMAFDKMGVGFHPVVSTMMPKKNPKLKSYIESWLLLKNDLNGEAGLQLSINTTSDKIRAITMPEAMDLKSISELMKLVINTLPEVKGRKITLNFALTEAPISSTLLRELFDPQYFICKITPMHKTNACVEKGLLTDNGYDHYYPYKEVEASLKDVGFDVIVFIPSEEEDSSRITCGNALLSIDK